MSNIHSKTKFKFKFKSPYFRKSAVLTLVSLLFMLLMATSPFTSVLSEVSPFASAVKYYTVTVNNSYAAVSGEGSYSSCAKPIIDAGTRNGYIFDGWVVNAGGIKVKSSTSPLTTFNMPCKNVIVTANWKPIQYRITYVLNGGINAAGNPSGYTVESNFPINIANPTRVDYDFAGWIVTYANGTTDGPVTSYAIPAGTTGDVMLTATWQDVVRYGTIEITHIDSTDWSVLDTTILVVPAGSYGPYGPESFSGYDTGTLAPGSAPASGTITANEVKYIIYMYTPLPPQPATIVISH
ncbi:MAG: InlB B-repeat-containing protein, partial [Candidatus Bathyarchaeota archaeon]|nr:InlB B-repeat-containing protein [Candidatus Termiticorpusculum sp.]